MVLLGRPASYTPGVYCLLFKGSPFAVTNVGRVSLPGVHTEQNNTQDTNPNAVTDDNLNAVNRYKHQHTVRAEQVFLYL